MDKGKPVDVVYLYFAKTFAKVTHKCILYKHGSFGIDGIACTRIENWLQMSIQGVVINGIFYEWLRVVFVMPQDSLGANSVYLVHN